MQPTPTAGEDTFAALHEETEKLNNAIDAVDKWLARKAPHLACLDAGVRRALHAEDSPSPAMRAWRPRPRPRGGRGHICLGRGETRWGLLPVGRRSHDALGRSPNRRQVRAAAQAGRTRGARERRLQKALAAARQSADHELFDDAYPELSRGLMARERDAERPNLVLKIGRQSGDRMSAGAGQFFGPKWLEVDGGRNAIAGDAAGTFDGPALNGALMRAADVVANWREHSKENAHSRQAYVSVRVPTGRRAASARTPSTSRRAFPASSRAVPQALPVRRRRPRGQVYLRPDAGAVPRRRRARRGGAVLYQNDAAETVDLRARPGRRPSPRTSSRRRARRPGYTVEYAG